MQGSIADLALPHVLAGATHVIVAMPGAPDAQREHALIALARQTGLAVMSVPGRVDLEEDTQDAGAGAPTLSAR